MGTLRKHTQDSLIQQYRICETKLKRPPSRTEFKKITGIGKNTINQHFGSWGQFALQLSGTIYSTTPTHGKAYQLPVKVYNSYPQIKAEKVLIAFDPHCPYHCQETTDWLLDVARHDKVKTLLIGGDLIDMKSLYKKEKTHADWRWTQELQITADWLEKLYDQFANIYILMGNHDWRLFRYLDVNEADDMIKMIFKNPKVIWSNYFYALINDWLYVLHPDAMRKNKLSLAEEICDHHRKSVLMGHSHRFAYAIHDSGKAVVAEGLCLTRPLAHEYRSIKLTTHSEWIKGFWEVDGQRLIPFVDHKHTGEIWGKNEKRSCAAVRCLEGCD